MFTTCTAQDFESDCQTANEFKAHICGVVASHRDADRQAKAHARRKDGEVDGENWEFAGRHERIVVDQKA